MTFGYEMRKLTRVPMEWPATITSPENEVLVVALRDLSLNGAFVVSEKTFPEGTEFRFLAEYFNEAIEAKGTVIRLEPDGMALEFSGLDKEGLDHLVELLAEHAEDADLVRAEVLEDWKLNIEIY